MRSAIAERYADLIEDEFARLNDDAIRLGLEPPPAGHVMRVTLQASPPDRRISGLAWGSGHPRYVMLHGAGLHARSWDSVNLTLGAPALALDLPGHGDSDWREDCDYRAAALAEQILPTLSGRIPGGAHFVGQSLGALAAVELAARRPELVRSLVLVDITPSRNSASPGSDRIRQFISGPDSYASYEEVVERARTSGLGTDVAQLERGVVLNTRRRPDGRIVFRHHLASPSFRPAASEQEITYLWELLERVTVPTLLVRGTRGIVDEAQAEEFERRVPGSRVATLAAGHNVQRDAPRELAGLIARHTRLGR